MILNPFRWFRRTEQRASWHPSSGDPALVALFGGGNTTEAGVTVTESNSLGMSTAFACVRIIAETVGTLPFHVMEQSGDNSVKMQAGPLPYLLHYRPNEWQTPTVFKQMLTAHMALWGNAYAAIEWNQRGDPANLVPLLPDRTAPVRLESGRLVYRTRRNDGSTIDLSPEDVLHLLLFSEDGLTGVSPVTRARNTMGLAMGAEAYGSRFFKNDARPSLVLSHPAKIMPEAAARLKSDIEGKFGGANQHRPMVLQEGMKIESVGFNAKDAQFIETRKLQREMIVEIFRVPASYLPGMTSAALRNVEEDSIRLARDCVMPYAIAWEQELTKKLVSSRKQGAQRVHVNLDGLMRGAFLDRVDALTKAIQNGLMTPNEARAKENMPRMDGGDDLYLQQNMAGMKAIQNGTAGNKVGNAIKQDEEDAA